MNIRERRCGIVVVALQAVLEISPISGYFIDHEPCFLHGRTTVFKVAHHFDCRFFKSAIETERFGIPGAAILAGLNPADPCVGAIPIRRRVQ